MFLDLNFPEIVELPYKCATCCGKMGIPSIYTGYSTVLYHWIEDYGIWQHGGNPDKPCYWAWQASRST